MRAVQFFAMGVCLLIATAGAEISQFDFNGDLGATLGSATLDFGNGATTSGLVTFGTASSLGLPALAGGDAGVMSFPAFASDQGLQLEPATSANGGGDYVNQYTLVYDLLVPDVSAGWFSFYNTNYANSNDGDAFIRTDGGIGIGGVYEGTVTSGQWHRIAIVWDVDSMYKYIDGVNVGSQLGISGTDGRWSLYTTDHGEKTWILTDDSGDTNAGYISSLLFANEALDADTIAGFGGADADGAIPEPATLMLLGLGACMLRKRRA
jgi:hypothetical protein